jgi:HD-GYP domain-containing protein (c-di-GMP phosphodiesterase class II)
MHDLGEVAMERDYIQRAGSLTAEERSDLARHPVIGEQEAARASADRAAQLLVRWHHEWWDGSGYPDALRQNEIPLAARILRVADSYASLTDARPFRPALSEEEAREELSKGAAIEFDPSVVTVLLSLRDVAELRSFAKPADSLATASAIDEDWTLFSSFMK